MADTALFLLPGLLSGLLSGLMSGLLFGATGLALTGFFALATLLGLTWVLWHDLRRFEIDFAALGVAALAMGALIVLLEGPQAALAAVALAALVGACTAAVRCRRPSGMGAGDPWLFAGLGLAGGPEHLVLVTAAGAVLGLAAARAWARARGKRLFRSMFPAAICIVPAMGLGLMARGLSAAQSLPAGLERLALPLGPMEALALLALSGVFCLGLWLGSRLPRQRGS